MNYNQNMRLSKKQSDFLKRGKLAILATSNSEGEPRAIVVEINRAEREEIIITDNEMGRTKENILENKKVFILAFKKDYAYGLKISGKAEYRTKGECFDFVKNLKANKDYSPKGAVVISIKDIKEFR